MVTDALHDVSHLFETDYYKCGLSMHSELVNNSMIGDLNTTMNTTMATTTMNPNYFINDTSLVKPIESSSCRMDRPILAVFLMLITVWLANKLSTLNQTSFFTRRVREMISDYSLPIAILFFSLIANTVFQVGLISFLDNIKLISNG